MASCPSRRVRACLGALWVLDAALQTQPHFFGYDWWHNDLAGSVMGQPAPISHSILWATSHLATHATLANTFAVVVQASLGLCLLLGRFERAAIAASIPWSLAVWWVGEGFGSLPTGLATQAGGAPGAALLYPLIGLLCWPGPDRRNPSENRNVRTQAALVSWSALWVGGALLGLPWRFPAARMIQANIEQNGLGQPHWLSSVSDASYRTVGSHPLLLPCVLFAVQLAIGIGVLTGPTRRYAPAAGAGVALVFWVTVQSLGGLPTGGATDPGSGPLLVLLAILVGSAKPADPRIQDRPRSEYMAWSSTSRTTRNEPTASVGTTWISAASHPPRSNLTRCAACDTCTMSNTTPFAT